MDERALRRPPFGGDDGFMPRVRHIPEDRLQDLRRYKEGGGGL